MLKTRTRKAIAFIALLFVGYSIYTSPSHSADAVHAVWNVIVSAVTAVFAFFGHLING